MGFLFIGERRSPTAIRRGLTWRDGRLCARNLFDALQAAGIDPNGCDFENLFRDDAQTDWSPRWDVVERCRRAASAGTVVVALGKPVAATLANLRIRHLALTHPAARGFIRKTERYRAHVAAVLAPALEVA